MTLSPPISPCSWFIQHLPGKAKVYDSWMLNRLHVGTTKLKDTLFRISIVGGNGELRTHHTSRWNGHQRNNSRHRRGELPVLGSERRVRLSSRLERETWAAWAEWKILDKRANSSSWAKYWMHFTTLLTSTNFRNVRMSRACMCVGVLQWVCVCVTVCVCIL